MALISGRAPSGRVDLCHACHAWVLSNLSYEQALGRSSPGDAFLFRVDLLVDRCGHHVVSCMDRLKECVRLNDHVAPFSVFLTSEEMDVARRSGGAGLYSQAPTSTMDGNTHFATYRLGKKDRRGDPLSCCAVDHIFGWLVAALQAGRVAYSTCCCRRTSSTGMLVVEPLRLSRDAPKAESKEEHVVIAAADPAPSGAGVLVEEPDPVELHNKESLIPGVELLFDPASESTDDAPLAVRYLPLIEERLFWANSQRNVLAAIKGRIEDPEVPVNLTEEERAEIKAVSGAVRRRMVQDRKLISTIASSLLGIDKRKSSKWLLKRAERGLRELRETYAPRYQFEAAVKLEPSVRGKAPRLLVADGDRGQIMAWLIIGTLEKYLFKIYKERSIKGVPKPEAMARAIRNLAQTNPRAVPGSPGSADPQPVAILENDGSAWDACMSSTLRDLIENDIMDEMAGIVGDFFLQEGSPDCDAARLASNRLQTLVLSFRKGRGEADRVAAADLPKGKCWRTAIRAIRRSGCRGTSVLNFLANLICWAWVIGGKDATKLVAPEGGRVVCVDGFVRWVKFMLEGDDSALSFQFPGDPERNMTERFRTLLHARWVKLGHRPKLYHRLPGEVAEFTGWKFVVDQHGLTEACAPDLKRNLCVMPFSTNKAAIEAAVKGDVLALRKAVAPGIISRLYPLARKLPQFCSVMYGRWKQYVREETEFTRDEVFALDLDPEDVGFEEYRAFDVDQPDDRIHRQTIRFQTILARFESELARGDELEEPELAKSLGLVASIEGYYDLLEVVEGGFEVGAASAGFADAVRVACAA